MWKSVTLKIDETNTKTDHCLLKHLMISSRFPRLDGYTTEHLEDDETFVTPSSTGNFKLNVWNFNNYIQTHTMLQDVQDMFLLNCYTINFQSKIGMYQPKHHKQHLSRKCYSLKQLSRHF